LKVASIPVVATLLLLMTLGLDATPSTPKLAVLGSISYNQVEGSVSIVLHLNDHRPFTIGNLDSGLYVDIENTQLSPELLASGTQVPSDSAIQLKAWQLRQDTARVSFHFEAIARVQAIPLKDPSRILVEIDLPETSTEVGDSLSASTLAATPNADILQE
jgi:hypothetical protein